MARRSRILTPRCTLKASATQSETNGPGRRTAGCSRESSLLRAFPSQARVRRRRGRLVPLWRPGSRLVCRAAARFTRAAQPWPSVRSAPPRQHPPRCLRLRFRAERRLVLLGKTRRTHSKKAGHARHRHRHHRERRYMNRLGHRDHSQHHHCCLMRHRRSRCQQRKVEHPRCCRTRSSP